jgi:uncharacterized protein (DUF697 family)
MYVDGLAVSALQLKMLAELSEIYGVPFQENSGKAALASLACFIIPHAGALGALSNAIPVLNVLGAPLAATFAGAYSWALGNIFIQHFESGGTFLTFDPEKVREHFKALFETGRQTVPPVPA